MSETQLISGCAPTLAGLKTANLFSCHCDDRNEAQSVIDEWNRQLNPKGVYAIILRYADQRALVYVYRMERLRNDLKRQEVAAFLRNFGYDTENLSECISHLAGRINENGEFPHEIGMFLGYPFEDVVSFIEKKGRDYKFSGLWKVYSHEEESEKLFAMYRKCTSVYRRRFQDGFSLKRLTVAGKGLQ